MTSLRRRPDRPVESVELRITFRTDRGTAAKIKESIPGTVLRSGGCEVRVEGEEPIDVAEKARVILEKLREIAQSPKDFK